MIRRSAKSAILVATAMGLLASTSAAMAQSRADDERFQAAQERFDRELALFRTEFDGYQQARAGAPQAGQDGRSYDDRARDDRNAPYDRDDRDGAEGPDSDEGGPPPR